VLVRSSDNFWYLDDAWWATDEIVVSDVTRPAHFVETSELQTLYRVTAREVFRSDTAVEENGKTSTTTTTTTDVMHPTTDAIVITPLMQVEPTSDLPERTKNTEQKNKKRNNKTKNETGKRRSKF